jgi:hypothetical protein
VTAWDNDGIRVLGFFPADHAAAESGKVYANGAYWSTLRFPTFPATLPAVTLVAVLEQPFHAADATHAFAIALQDADGRLQGLQVRGEFRSGPGPDGQFGDANVVPITVPLYGLPFEQTGDYAFVLTIEDRELARYSFHVQQAVT